MHRVTNSHYIDDATQDMTSMGGADAQTAIDNGCGGVNVVNLQVGQIDDSSSANGYGGYGVDEYGVGAPFVSLSTLEQQILSYEAAYNATVLNGGKTACNIFQYTAISFSDYFMCPEASNCSTQQFAVEFADMMNDLISQSDSAGYQAHEYLEYGGDLETEYYQCIWDASTNQCYSAGDPSGQGNVSSWPLVDGVLTTLSANDPNVAGFSNFGDDTPGNWSQTQEAKVMDGLNGSTGSNEYSPMPMRAVPQIYNAGPNSSVSDFQATIEAQGPIYFYGEETECEGSVTNGCTSVNNADSLTPSEAFTDFQQMLSSSESALESKFPLETSTNI